MCKGSFLEGKEERGKSWRKNGVEFEEKGRDGCIFLCVMMEKGTVGDEIGVSAREKGRWWKVG